ncbi:response regulator transcription factor [Massilia sp. Leaf139]|uniref:response regulator transcription factor n=1 Tax=Massilia sp. Leaf139 TaxID=1736272 RepID=UPI000A6EF2D4|nr:response regulator transcription factor [Massilia sp. Leaf139]
MNPPRIRIVIAEDQALVRGALAALLGLEPDFEVVGLAADGKDALALCEQLRPDIVLTDIEMPRMTGLELAAALAERALASRVVIVTTFGRSGYLRRALAAGVRGYLLKDAPADNLAAAIRNVHGGGRAVAPELALEIWGGAQDPLSERERQVLRLAGEGRSSTDIARQVHLSEGTVRNYLSEAISKLGAANRIEAYRMARDAGWL